MKYEVVMGLEVHIELATQSKLFCSCSAKFGARANDNVCPACCGMPGMPAVLNRKAVELGIAAGIVTNSRIAKTMTFDKKSYFYPDLPTGYQITQFYAPICTDGWVDILTESGVKRITLKQIHIEEDAGKLLHDGPAHSALVDFNRASVPLVEIVSNPDFRTAAEVVAYLEKLRSMLSFAGVSDCKMQEGSMRCDVNLSVRPADSEGYGVRTEVKNLNSLKSIAAVIAYESERHIDILEGGGGKLVQETRGWDEDRGETFSMREKENATDYRYFPNPEIMPVVIPSEWIEEVRTGLPEPAHEKFERLTETLGLPEYDSKIITGSKNLSDIFDRTVALFDKPKEVANWIITELLGVAKIMGKGEDDILVDCRKFARVLTLIDDRTINRNVGKKLLALVLAEDVDPDTHIRELGLGMVSDDGSIRAAIAEALAGNPKSVAEYKAGNQKVFGFFVGQVMRRLGGKADPQKVNPLLAKALDDDE